MIRKYKPKKKSSGGKSVLIKKLDDIFSKYIRLRDILPGTEHFRCISCNQIKHIKQADNGHYINRKHMSVRFNEMNCNAQCRDCNRFDEGNIMGYRMGLIKKHGENKVLLLESAKGQIKNFKEYELKEFIEEYKKEVKRLEIEKGYKL